MAEPFLGEIRLFSFGQIPQGWVSCNGQLLNVNSNQALFSIIGATYGGDGRSTFAVPNLQGKVPLHQGNAIPYGTAAGEAVHTLTVNELPSHTHDVSAESANTDKPSPANNTWGTVSGKNIYAKKANTTMDTEAMSITGDGIPHNNMQPYLAISFCMATQGIYPSRS